MSSTSGLEATALWQETLGTHPSHTAVEVDARERLRASYRRFRDQALLLAHDIAQSIPSLTVHDDSHLDALWELARPIVGGEITFTPNEAFVFGGAVLVHDLGLGLAAYPEGRAALEETPAYRESLWATIRRQTGHFPRPSEVDDATSSVRAMALEALLRERHAEQAALLPITPWFHPTLGPTYLLEDVPLREAYGWLIGRIAASHWWSVERLAREFTVLSNAAVGPADWTVDPLKLSCVLRLTDAAHLDARRAPYLLRAVRKPQGVSKDHWEFLERLQPVRVESDRLRYRSGRPFPATAASAWWLGFDMLQSVDAECRRVDALFADVGRERFAVTGVFGAESPDRLARVIETSGWTPVRAEFRASNVRALIEKLGGTALYGADVAAPVRELIQNAADAVRARRVAEGRDDTWGEVNVAIGEDATGSYIEVRDTGLGMSTEIISEYLLNFGNSLWDSPELPRVVPSLGSKRFEPVGRFGIGFFSVFMLGENVRVSSRRFDTAPSETVIMDLAGLGDRPLLRIAHPHEQLADGGTVIRVWLGKNIDALMSRMRRQFAVAEQDGLAALCAWMCPTLDVTLGTNNRGHDLVAVEASDWLSMSAEALLSRIAGDPYGHGPWVRSRSNLECARTLTDVRDREGRVIGRLAIPNSSSPLRHAVVTIGGLRIGSISDVAGVISGRDPDVARKEAQVAVEQHELAQWASEQASVHAQNRDYVAESFVAGSVMAFGGDPDPLSICMVGNGEGLSRAGLHEWAAERDKIRVDGHTGGRMSSVRDGRARVGVDSTSVFPPRWAPEVEVASLLEVVETTIREAWGGDVSRRQVGARDGSRTVYLTRAATKGKTTGADKAAK
jgi:hypothetical protein